MVLSKEREGKLLEIISQVMIAILGISSILLIAMKNKLGFPIGLIAQPFYYYTTIHNHQWGLVIATVGYTGSWAYGLYQWYFRKGENQ